MIRIMFTLRQIRTVQTYKSAVPLPSPHLPISTWVFYQDVRHTNVGTLSFYPRVPNGFEFGGRYKPLYTARS